MAHRRKAATYGKASRKPIFDFGSVTRDVLAQTAITSTWNPKDRLHDRDGSCLFIPGNEVHGRGSKDAAESFADRTISSKSQPSLKGIKATNTNPENRSVLASSDAGEDDAVFDGSSYKDGRQLRVSPFKDLHRKRRKYTPDTVIEEGSLVYDEESLQRHIAAEVRNSTRRSPRYSGNATVEGSSPPGPQTSVKNQGERQYSPSGQRNTVPSTRDPRNQRALSRSITRDTRTTSGGKAALNSQSPLEEARRARVSPRKAEKAINRLDSTSTRLETYETHPPTNLAHRSGGKRKSFPSPKDTLQPSTPPRPMKLVDGTTTPRQRELWSKLLPDNVQTGSPSHLDLPGLKLTEMERKGFDEPPTVRRVVWADQNATSLKFRPKRIVDTLHPSENDQSNSDYDRGDNGDISSSSSDDQSDSMRSEGSAVNGAATIQTSPSADSQAKTSKISDRPSSKISQSIPSLQAGGLKVTYARQRSYLTDSSLDEAAMLSEALAPPVASKGFGRKGPWERSTTSPPNPNFDEEIGDIKISQGGAMKSIHELRKAGGNVRLVSELEAMLDEIAENEAISSTLRRSRLLDLVSRLQEPSNCRLFIDQGMEARLLAHVDLSEDPVVNSLFAVAVLQLIFASPSASLLSQVSDCRVVSFLIRLLGLEQDILSKAKLREYKLSKLTQLQFSKACHSLLKSTAWRGRRPPMLSSQILSLQCLEHIVRRTRESGCFSEILSTHAIRRIVTTSVPPFSRPSSQPTAMSVICLELAVSILESSTVSTAAECQESLWANGTLDRVIGILPLVASWPEQECGTLRTLSLRLYINLTNNSPGLCEDFSTPDIINVIFGIIVSHFDQLSDSSVNQRQPLLLDILILSLGLLVNLAESTDILRHLILNLRQGDHLYLDILLQLFVNKSKSAAEVQFPCPDAIAVC